jgi:hypothetical protein
LKESVRSALSEKETLLAKNSSLSLDRERFLTELTTLRCKWQDLEQQFLLANQESEKYRQEAGQLNERIILADAMAGNAQKEMDHLKEQLKKEAEASHHNLERMKVFPLSFTILRS